MTPSERISAIKDVAAALQDEDWPLIDLTLKQFGLPWTDNWQGGERSAYVIDIISEADDAPLLELAKHVGVKSELATVESPTFWKPEEPRLFISHISKHKKEATELRTALLRFGINGFVAHEDIEPTKEWQTEIEVALLTMDALLAYLTPGFNESKWTDQEIGVAVGRKIHVVPVRAGQNIRKLPARFSGTYTGIESKITAALVGNVAHSDSWAESKSNMDYLERCQHLRPHMIRALEHAIDTNSQVRDAWGVPDRIKALIKKKGS